MAVIDTPFSVALGNMAMETIPYAGAGGMAMVNTPVPRAEVNFTFQSGAVTLSGSGDTQSLTISCALPPSFAYIVQEVSITDLAGVDGDNWDNFGISRIRVDTPDKTWKHSLDLFSRGSYQSSPTTRGKSYHLAAPGELNRMLIPLVSANLVILLQNPTTQDSAMIVGAFFARFLQFDVNQAYFYGANVPLPVR